MMIIILDFNKIYLDNLLFKSNEMYFEKNFNTLVAMENSYSNLLFHLFELNITLISD